MVTGFQLEILTANGQLKLFAKAHTIHNTRELFGTSTEPNYSRTTAFILSIPVFIVCHCFLELLCCQYLKNRILS